jgi:hypothetical protein
MAAFACEEKSMCGLKRAMIGAMMGFSVLHASTAKSHMPDLFSSASSRFCAILEKDFPDLAVQIGNLFPGQSMLT